MFKISIIKDSVITHMATFSSEEEYVSWLESCEATKAFGQPAWIEIIPATEEQEEQVIQHEAEYTVEVVEDWVNQEAVNAEALQYLADTDYYVLRAIEDPNKPVPSDISAARQAARERVIR